MKKAWLIWQSSGGKVLLKRATAKARAGVQLFLADSRNWLGAKARVLATSRIKPLTFLASTAPEISVILTTGPPAHSLFRSLAALRHASGDGPAMEILVVQRPGSSVPGFLDSLSAVRVARAGSAGLPAALNQIASQAQGRYLFFLGDAAIRSDTLSCLLASASTHAAISPQVRAPGGRVLDAGGCLSIDRTARIRGSKLRPSDPAIASTREIDFCAHSMFISRDSFESAGGFAAFESWVEMSADLCLRLRGAGQKVIYDPRAVIVAQEILHGEWPLGKRFCERWFAESGRSSEHFVFERERVRRAILVIDDYVPMFDQGAGGKRMFELLKLMRDIGLDVIFVPDQGAAESYTAMLRRIGIEVRPRRGNITPVEQVTALKNCIHVAWLSRPDICEKYLPILRESARVRVIYDTVDLHHRRLALGEAVNGIASGWKHMQNRELSLARASDRTIVTTIEEQRVLLEHGIDASAVVPVIQPYAPEKIARFEARSGLLFLGNYTHRPNVDAARWFAREILPRLRQRIPNITLTLAGAEPNPQITSLASRTVTVTGYLKNLDLIFERSRVFIAPLRYGAGMKGKIVDALAHGVPIVTTTGGAEGFGFRDGQDALIADSAEGFACAVETLYGNPARWNDLSQNGLQTAKKFTPDAVRPMLERALDFSDEG